MYKKLFLLALTVLFSVGLSAQELEKKWQLSSSETDYLELKEGRL